MARAPDTRPGLRREAVALARDFLRYAGTDGVAGAALIALGGLLEGIGLLLLVPIVGLLLGHPTGATGPATRILSAIDPTGRALLLTGAFAVAVIVRGVVLAARDALLARLQHGFAFAVQLRVMGRLAAAPWPAAARLGHGQVMQTLGADIQQCGVAAHYALQGVVACVVLATSCAVMLVVAPLPSMLAIALLGAMAVAHARFLPRIHAMGDRVLREHGRMTDGTMRFLAALKLAIAQNLRGDFLRDYRASSQAAVDHRVAFLGLQARLRNAATTLAALAGAIMVLAGTTVLHLDAPRLVVLIVAVARISTPVTVIEQCVQQIAHALPSYRAVATLADGLPAPLAMPPPITTAGIGPMAIEFRDVSYAHGRTGTGEGRGVRSVRVSMAPGSLVGVAGPSGAGKTSFVDLAMGLMPPQGGAILIDGVPLTPAMQAAHGDRVAYVGRDPVLFGGTVRENLLWGAAPGLADGDLAAALRIAAAADFASLDMMLDDRAQRLSAGEQQRLAIARALLRSASLMVLDEATASIDLATERAILAALRALPARPTILFISHRAESFALCDRVLTFADGLLAGDTLPLAPGNSAPVARHA